MADKFCIVRKTANPEAHKAWANFRLRYLDAAFVHETYSVPTMYPPTTEAGIGAYVAYVQTIRENL